MTNLPPHQAKAAELIAAGDRKKVVAEKVGVSPQTISEWQLQPAFQAYFNELRWAVLKAARDQMQRLAEDATETIGELMEQTESPMVRLRAAQTVLDFNGLKDPQSGLWGWGIGSTDEEAVAREMASKPIRL